MEGAIGQHWAAAAIGETLVSLEFTVSQATLSRPTDGGPASVYPHVTTPMFSVEMKFGF